MDSSIRQCPYYGHLGLLVTLRSRPSFFLCTIYNVPFLRSSSNLRLCLWLGETQEYSRYWIIIPEWRVGKVNPDGETFLQVPMANKGAF